MVSEIAILKKCRAVEARGPRSDRREDACRPAGLNSVVRSTFSTLHESGAPGSPSSLHEQID